MRLPALAIIVVCYALGAISARIDAAESITLFSYSDYIDPEIPKQFEQATGIHVRIDVYEAQDEMLAKLQAGGGGQYDVIIATDVVVRSMIRLKLVQPLDQRAIPNAQNVMARFRNPAFDPGNVYSYPYQWGSTGLMYRTAKMPPGALSWAVLFDQGKQPGPFVLMDEMRSMSGIALRYLGHGASSRKPDEIKAAGDLLITTKHSGKCLGFDGGVGAMNKVLTGEAVAAVVYNGDAVKNMPKDGSCAYAIPIEGSIISVDNLLVSAKAANAAGAQRFINYILDAKVGAQLSNFNRYATPNQASLPFIAKDDAANPAIYPSDEQMKKLEFQEDVGADIRLYDEVWTAVKTR